MLIFYRRGLTEPGEALADYMFSFCHISKKAIFIATHLEKHFWHIACTTYTQQNYLFSPSSPLPTAITSRNKNIIIIMYISKVSRGLELEENS